MRQQRIFLLGAGAVGSRNALLLAEHDMTLIVVDHDAVEEHNTIGDRTLYQLGDVGQLKVYALRDKLAILCPNAVVDAHPRNVHDFTDGELRLMAQQCAAALVAVDEGAALLRLNHLLYSQLMMLYQGVHRLGQSGQVIITRPGSPCLKCCLDVQDANEIQTLHHEPGLGVHTGAVAQLAVQVLVQELAARGGSPLGQHLGENVSVLFTSHMASELTPSGPGIVCFAATGDPECEVCGNLNERR